MVDLDPRGFQAPPRSVPRSAPTREQQVPASATARQPHSGFGGGKIRLVAGSASLAKTELGDGGRTQIT